MPIIIPTPLQVLDAFIKDVEAAHGAGAPALADEWPDLHVTYEQAIVAREAARRSTVSNDDLDLIFDIVDKAWPTMEAMGWFYRNDVTLKVILCHTLVWPLDLEAMRDGPLLDILHDVAGISRHFNIRTRQMEDCFVPRYASEVPA
jgi:hypothetical protein